MKERCVLEFFSTDSAHEWKEVITEKSEQIEQFLGRNRITIGNIGELKTDGMSLKKQETLISLKLDKKNDYDHLVKDNPHQLQQSYEASIQKVSFTIDGVTQFQLKSKSANPSKVDTLIYSS